MVHTFCVALFWKNVEILEKRPFFRADMARLGKYSMGGYGLIGVYRAKVIATSTASLYQGYVL